MQRQYHQKLAQRKKSKPKKKMCIGMSAVLHMAFILLPSLPSNALRLPSEKTEYPDGSKVQGIWETEDVASLRPGSRQPSSCTSKLSAASSFHPSHADSLYPLSNVSYSPPFGSPPLALPVSVPVAHQAPP